MPASASVPAWGWTSLTLPRRDETPYRTLEPTRLSSQRPAGPDRGFLVLRVSRQSQNMVRHSRMTNTTEILVHGRLTGLRECRLAQKATYKVSMPPRFGDRDGSVGEYDNIVSSIHSWGSEGGRLGSGVGAMCSVPDLAYALFLVVHTLGSSLSSRRLDRASLLLLWAILKCWLPFVPEQLVARNNSNAIVDCFYGC